MKRIINIFTVILAFMALSCNKNEMTGTLPAPGNLKATLSGQTISLSWDEVPEAMSYIVYYGSDKENGRKKSPILYETLYSIEECEEGATYNFKVRAANNSASGLFSETVSVMVPAPENPGTKIEKPEISNIRSGIGWINFTMKTFTGGCTYAFYEDGREISLELEKITSDEISGTSEYSLSGLEQGKTYENLTISRRIGDKDESETVPFGTVKMGRIEVLKRNLSPRHLAFEWDDVAGNANWTFDSSIDPLTRTYKLELAKDPEFKDIVYSIYTVNNFNSAGGAYHNNNWVGESGTPLEASKPYANCNTNIVFGQLEPSTTYYFRLRNASGETVENLYEGDGTTITMSATNGRSSWSSVVSATTEPVHEPAQGELLWQGFDDHAIQFDHINCAAGVIYAGKDVSYSYPWKGEWGVIAPSTGIRYDEIGASYTDSFSGNGETSLDGLAVYKFNDDIIPSMKGWHCAKACYPGQGALKLGGSSGQKNYIITPPFDNLLTGTPVTISCSAGAAHATSAPALLHIKIYRNSTKSLETVASINLPNSAYIPNPYGDGYHNIVEMKDYKTDAVLMPGDYVMFESETIKSPLTIRMMIDNIQIVEK